MMNRSHVALALLLASPVALYAVVILPREIPTSYAAPTSPTAYFPTTVGTRWTYKVTNHGRLWKGKTYDKINVVTAVFERDGERIVTVQQLKGDSPEPLNEYALSESGLRHRSIPDPNPLHRSHLREPGRWITALPARIAPGETWIEDRPDDLERIVSTITGWERVSVPAGAYYALRVEIELTEYERGTKKPGLTITGAFWYVPGIGEVKLALRIDPNLWGLTRELASFTPGNR